MEWSGAPTPPPQSSSSSSRISHCYSLRVARKSPFLFWPWLRSGTSEGTPRASRRRPAFQRGKRRQLLFRLWCAAALFCTSNRMQQGFWGVHRWIRGQDDSKMVTYVDLFKKKRKRGRVLLGILLPQKLEHQLLTHISFQTIIYSQFDLVCRCSRATVFTHTFLHLPFHLNASQIYLPSDKCSSGGRVHFEITLVHFILFWILPIWSLSCLYTLQINFYYLVQLFMLNLWVLSKHLFLLLFFMFLLFFFFKDVTSNVWNMKLKYDFPSWSFCLSWLIDFGILL